MPKSAHELVPIFSSPRELNQKTDESLMNGIKSTFPVEDKNFRIDVSDTWVDHKFFDHGDQKTAILKSDSLTYPVKGTLTMTDKATGKVVDTVKNFNLADTYGITDKHTIVSKGNNYSVANLIVLKPGVYTRSRDNGELESSFNTQTGSGMSIVLDPRTLIFRVRAGSSKSAGEPLFPLLYSVFGVSDSTILKFIPQEILEANKTQTQGQDNKVIQKLYGKMVNKRLQNKDLSKEDKAAALREALESSGLDEETTGLTLGARHSHVNADVLLRSMRNLVEVSRGDRPEDNRDSLQFKKVQNLPDFIGSYFTKSNAKVTGTVKAITRSLGKVNRADPKIRSVLGAKPFNKIYSDFLTKSSLSSNPTETNPIESIENVAKATIIGPGYGGISSHKAVPPEARNIDPSHLGILDPSRTPESGMAGIDQRFTMTSRRDADGNMFARVLDNNGREKYLSSNEMMNSIIGFPGDKDKEHAMAQVHGKFKRVPTNTINYWIPSGSDMYTVTTNMVPFLNSNHPGRLTMAGKAIPQSLSLRDREAPLVQTVDYKGKPYVDSIAGVFSSTTVKPGMVSDVTKKSVTIVGADGVKHTEKLVDNLPYNMKGFHDDDAPSVKVGDVVKQGQILADNNYTKDGKLAIGKNLHVAYMPYKGYNHEDGIVVSRSAAQSMVSNHAYKYDYQVRKTTKLDANLFRSSFQKKYSPQQLQDFQANGSPKKGRELHYGDPIWLIMEDRVQTETDRLLGKLHKSLISKFRDASLIWDHHEVGKIVDVDYTGKNIRVLIRSEKELEEGDKITGLHGNKGVVSLILEDDEMPHSKETGKAVDVIQNPASVTSRINLGQVMETAAAKIAQKTGKPYLVDNYKEKNNVKKLKAELAHHGLSDTEELFDPKTGVSFGTNILAGPQYTLKLDKTVDANYSARSVGKYDNVGQPSKGGDEGAKSVGYMEFLGLLGSNARKNLKEIGTIKSEGGPLTDSSDYWDKYVRGRPLPKPQTTFATKKFFDYMTGSGISVVNRNGKLTLKPLTDGDVLARSNGEVLNGRVVQGRDAKAEKGGLFDQHVLGGLEGTKWGHMALPEPIVNPVMEDPVRNMLGLKRKEFKDLTSGKIGVKRKYAGSYDLVNTSDDKVIRNITVSEAGMSKQASEESEVVVGGDAFKQMLSDIDTTAEVSHLKNRLKTVTSTGKKDEIIKRMKYLHGLSQQGFKDPSQAAMLHNLPVIPPVMRPVSVTERKVEAADVNALYTDAFNMRNSVGDINELFDADFVDLQNAREGMYGAAKAIMAAGDPVNFKHKSANLKGLMRQISGEEGPKNGFFQSKLLSKKQDISGRGTIYAAPDLSFNEAAIPKEQLWKMYEMHIKRDLAQKGYNPAAAKKAYESRNIAAKASFSKTVEDVPIILNRAPTLMRTNILALKAVPTNGKTLGLNILHLPGYAADYDGDALSMFAPVTPEAIKEAKEKLLPEDHLHDARKGHGNPMYAPGHEAILGSSVMTKPDMEKKTVDFTSEKDAVAALDRGDITVDTPIRIKK